MTEMKKHVKTQNNTRITKNITQMRSFLQNHKNLEVEIFAFCVITFEIHLAPQNDHLNLSFVKDIYVDG